MATRIRCARDQPGRRQGAAAAGVISRREGREPFSETLRRPSKRSYSIGNRTSSFPLLGRRVCRSTSLSGRDAPPPAFLKKPDDSGTQADFSVLILPPTA